MFMRSELVEEGFVGKLKSGTKARRRIAVEVACGPAFQASPVEVPIVVGSPR